MPYVRKNTTRRMPKRAPKNRANAKRKQIKRAYRPAAKRQIAASRRPFVEVKSRSHREFWATLGGGAMYAEVDSVVDPTVLVNMTTDTTPTGQALISRLFPLWSYYNPVQGITEKDMIGRTLTAKYLTCKVQFEWPQFPSLKAPRYYLIHGFVKVPPNLTLYTTPTKSAFTRGNMLTHIENHVKSFFDQNDKEEFLTFKEKITKDFITLGYRRIRANRNVEGGINPTATGQTSGTVIAGQNPIITTTLKWPLNNRKIKYSKGTNNDTVITGGVPFFYDNKGWQPFMMYYCPDAGDVLPSYQNSPSIAYNDKFWFTDS